MKNARFNSRRPGKPKRLVAHLHPRGTRPVVATIHATVPPNTPVQVQLDYAWAAGFLDGEGCVSLVRVWRTCGNRINYRVRVQISQNCLQTLEHFQQVVGESGVLKRLVDRESYTRPVYQLLYDGLHAHRLLHKLRPYLVRKAAEADVVFEYYRDGQPTRHFGPKGVPAEIWHFRERCFEALRCLK